MIPGGLPTALNGRIAVIGLGSPIMTDDSIGLRISEDIDALGMPDVDCSQEAIGGLELLPFMRGYSYVLIVDAIQTWNYEPGTILIFDVADFEDTVSRGMPAHDINIATAVSLGKSMDPDTMPLQVKFVAMEIQDMQTMSEELTPVVASKRQSMVNASLSVIESFRQDRRSKEDRSSS